MPVFLSLVPHEEVIIRSLVVILVTSSLVALIFQRLRLALIPAYLIAGVIAGPSGLGLIRSEGALIEIGHLAVVFLLFGVGMELHISSLRKDAFTLLGTSISSCLLSTLVGVPIVMSFGLSFQQSVVIAMGFSLSSTAVVLRFLHSSRQLIRGHGQLSLAILVTQDLLVLFMLAIIPALAVTGGAASGAVEAATGSVFLKGLGTALALLALFFTGQKLLPHILTESIRSRSSEVLMLCAIAAALLSAYITESLGFSLEMGAFLVGFLLASSPFRHQLAGQVAPLRDFFMAVFFTTLGMELDLAVVASSFDTILLGALVLLVAKALAIAVSAWIFGVHSRIAVLCGIILSQAGEFSLVVFGKSVDVGILSSEQFSVVVGIVVISLIVTPALFSLSAKLANLVDNFPPAPWTKFESLGEAEEGLISQSGNHVVVGGYGPVGQQVCKVLTDRGIPFFVIEMNARTVRENQREGVHFVYGEIATESVLRAVKIEDAQALIVTFPDSEAAINAAAQARLLNPNIEIVARASSTRERGRLEATDIDDAVVDEELSARAMVELAQRFKRH
jgi:CPA2 family monovalent cation:H+ antiporter-2